MFLAVGNERRRAQDPKCVEDILETIGGFSWFQVFALLILTLPELPTAMITMSPLLTGSTTLDYDQYSCADTPHKNVSKENFCEVVVGCAKFLYYGPTPYTSIVKEWRLYCERAWIVDMITSVQMAGNTLGALIFPQLADRFGRRKIFFIICLLLGLSGTITGFAPNVTVFAIFRFISGLCVGGIYLVYVNYLMEFLIPSYRTVCGCVSFWSFGVMLLALLGYFVPGWRKLSVVVSLPFLIVPMFYRWLPESPRWLLCQNRTAEATRVFNKIASCNGYPPVKSAHVQLVQAEIAGSVISDSTHRENSVQPTWKNWDVISIFKPSPYRRQFLFLICIWFTVNLVYYGVGFNTQNLGGDPYFNILFLGIAELPGPFLGLLLNNRFGRKQTLLGFASASCVFFTLLLILQLASFLKVVQLLHSGISVEQYIKILALLGHSCITAGFAIMACTTAESFPTRLRLTYGGTCGLVGNIGAIFAPQIVFLATVWASAPFIAFCLLSILVTVLCLGLKETSGEPLSDSSKNL